MSIIYHSITAKQPYDEYLCTAAYKYDSFPIHTGTLLDMLSQGIPTLTVRPQGLKEKQCEKCPCDQ
jgi:hypothetical protein